jgi:hypothetical protein
LKNPIFCVATLISGMHDVCLGPGKIDSLIMLDLQTKSAINSNNLQGQHKAWN